MKRFMQFLVVAALVVSAASMSFAAFVSNATVSMSATVGGVNSMTVVVKNVSDNATAAYALGSLASGGAAYNTKALQYAQINVNDNASSWKVRIWTNNYTDGTPSTTIWGFQYGGLRGDGAGSKIAMGWQAAIAIVASGITPDTPVNSATTGWSFLKDLKDVDDPSAPGDFSFATADADGYTTVAFGNGSYTNVVVPNAPGGSRALALRGDPFYIYTEADLSVASATEYTGTLVIDLSNY